MAIITITSDWGTKDACGAIIKATILNYFPQTGFVDISHQIEPFNILEASYVVKSAFYRFPANTIHLVCINTQDAAVNGIIVAKRDGQYFIAANNGILNLILEEQYELVCRVNVVVPSTFHELDSMVPIVCKLLDNKKLDEIGDIQDISKLSVTRIIPMTIDNKIIGRIIYIDNYENVITNISRTTFEKTRRGRRFIVAFSIYKIDRVSKSYIDVAKYEALVLFNSSDYLEIAVRQGNASSSLGLYIDTPIIIEFIDQEII